ncbi:MAG: serine/threonine-protein kinase [Silvibacterium sp.]
MPDSRIGAKVDGPNGETYRLSTFVGRGGFGEVFRAESTNGYTVAVKFINPDYFADSQVLFSLLNEAQTASRVKHENVLKLIYVGKSEDLGPYLISEFADGGTLADLIEKQRTLGEPMDVDRARELMLEIASGCRAISDVLIHRDLKPDNIFFLSTQLKIGDFGISKVIDETTRTHTFKGVQHIRYKAPESWRFESNTTKIDVYSAGLIFYEILSLVHPLLAAIRNPSDWNEWENAHLTVIPKSLRIVRPEIGLAIAQLVDRMMSKRPENRPQWDEVLQRLNSTIQTSVTDSGLAAAISSAVKRKEERERQAAEGERQRMENQRRENLYKTSCELLINTWQEVVDEFNAQFQGGQIEVLRRPNDTIYRLAGHSQINCFFFGPRDTNMTLRRQQIIGGGWIGIHNGPSGNLVLTRTPGTDLYGSWHGCLVKISPIASGKNLIGRFGISTSTKLPMGFRSEDDFYEQIRWADGGMHVFTYELRDDVKKFFIDFLETAFEPQ